MRPPSDFAWWLSVGPFQHLKGGPNPPGLPEFHTLFFCHPQACMCLTKQALYSGGGGDDDDDDVDLKGQFNLTKLYLHLTKTFR